MDNYDSNFEKIKSDFEKGIISVNDLNEEYLERLTSTYKKEIESNKKEIEVTKNKIKSLKNKIDNMV